MSSNDTTPATPLITSNEDALREIKTFGDAIALLESSGIAAVNYEEEYGDGFALIKGDDAKQSLVGVPFVILGIRLIEGDYEQAGVKAIYAAIHLVTQDGRKIVMIDGGTGVGATAMKMADRGHVSGVYVPKGLRRSDYEYIDNQGNKSPATTFYFSN